MYEKFQDVFLHKIANLTNNLAVDINLIPQQTISAHLNSTCTKFVIGLLEIVNKHAQLGSSYAQNCKNGFRRLRALLSDLHQPPPPSPQW